MLGIGFGALSVSTEASAASKSPTVDDTLLGGLRSSCDPFRIQAMKWLVTFQIVLGAFSVAFVIARVIAAAAARIERREPGWSGVHVGAGLVAALLAMMLFAGVQEGAASGRRTPGVAATPRIIRARRDALETHRGDKAIALERVGDRNSQAGAPPRACTSPSRRSRRPDSRRRRFIREALRERRLRRSSLRSCAWSASVRARSRRRRDRPLWLHATQVGVPLWGFSIGKLVETLLRANDERTLRRSRMARARAGADSAARTTAVRRSRGGAKGPFGLLRRRGCHVDIPLRRVSRRRRG